MTDRHPFSKGDRVWFLSRKPLRATISGVGWENGRPYVLIKLDRDGDTPGAYKMKTMNLLEPISAVDQLAETIDG